MDSIEMIVQGLVLGEYFMLGTHLHDKESAQPPQQVSNVDEIQPGWWQGKRVSNAPFYPRSTKHFFRC